MEKQQNIEMEPGFTHTPPRIKLSQYDFGYNLYLDMKDKGTAWSIPSNLEVRIMGTKGDGHGFDYGPSDGITYSGSRVTVPLKQQMTTWAGDTTVEVIFKSGTNMRIGSANFILEVEPAGMADDTRPSDSDIPALQIIAELAVRLDGLVDDLEQAVDDAQDAADSAATSATSAANSASAAASSANSAANSASAASTSESNAANSATSANTSKTSAAASAANAQEYARIAHSWANGSTSPDDYGTSVDNAKYWYQQARDVASGVIGGIKPMGTCAFANLPSLSSADNGDMYNISDAFTTDSRFKEGSGIPIAAGAEVYKTSDGYWSVMATNRVTSVNGSIGDVVINYKDMAIGTCTTAASTAAKKVTLSNSDKWVLREGAMIAVKFTYSNTAANMTIEVGSTGAKRVWMNGAVTSSGFSGTSAGHYSYFVFDGTYWVWLNYDYDTDNDTTYEGMSVAEMTTGTATTLRTLTAANLSSGLATLVPAKLGISSSGSAAKFLNEKGQWTTISFPDSPVASVNGKTGVVTLTASDVGALPNNTQYVSSFNGQTGAITYTAPVTSVAGATGAVAASSVLGYPSTSTTAGADTQYMLVQSSSSGTWSRKSLSTLKAYFQDGITSGVSSVNNKTGAVTLTASDVGAMPDTYTAPVTSVAGSTGAVTAATILSYPSTSTTAGADTQYMLIQSSSSGTWSRKSLSTLKAYFQDGITAGVTSVNGQTGAVTLTASDVGALASGTEVDKIYQVATTTSTAYPVLLSYNTTSSTKTTYSRFNSSFTYNPSTKVLAIPSGGDITIGGTSIVGSGAVTSVNGQTGAVTLTASDVGAMPDTYTAPVTSVAGSTGAVTSKTILSDPSTSTTAGADTQYMLVQASSTGTWYRKSLSTLKAYFGGSAGTDENVKQTITTTNSSYPVLFSYSTSTSTKTEGARMASSFTYNPSTKTLNVPSGGDITINGTSVKNAVTSVAGYTGAVTAANVLSYPSTSTTAGADTQYMLVQASSTGTWYRKSLSKLKEYFGGSGAVTSVNGKTGAVTLAAADVGAFTRYGLNNKTLDPSTSALPLSENFTAGRSDYNVNGSWAQVISTGCDHWCTQLMMTASAVQSAPSYLFTRQTYTGNYIPSAWCPVPVVVPLLNPSTNQPFKIGTYHVYNQMVFDYRGFAYGSNSSPVGHAFSGWGWASAQADTANAPHDWKRVASMDLNNSAYLTSIKGVTITLYEQTDTSLYNLPHPSCVVFAYGNGRSRGKAIAFAWPDGVYTWWVANMHDSWKSWHQMN